MYHRNVAYGNDIRGQNVDIWHDGLPERFAQFIRPIMPYDPFLAEGGVPPSSEANLSLGNMI